MTTNSSESRSATKANSPKKANLMDSHSIKNLLDESVSDIVTSRGYTKDVRLSNIRLLLGIIIIAIALVAQFNPKKFPHNRDFLIGCILFYTKEKNMILFTYPLAPEVFDVAREVAKRTIKEENSLVTSTS